MYFLLVCVHPDIDIFSIQFSNSVFIPLRIQLLQRLTMEGSFVLHVLQNRHMHLGMNSSHDAFQAHSRYRALVHGPILSNVFFSWYYDSTRLTWGISLQHSSFYHYLHEMINSVNKDNSYHLYTCFMTPIYYRNYPNASS